MNHFIELLPILTAMITLSSVAIFGFLLPKWADYFNDRPRTKLKDTLDIKKSLEASGRDFEAEKFDQIIEFYRSDFLRKELDFIESDEKHRDKKHGAYINRLFGLVFIIPVICLGVYLVLLGIIGWIGL